MKFTLNWLREFLEFDHSIDDLSFKLTSIGLEVEEIIDRRQELAAFKVAEILSVTKHPDAEKLQICIVNDGKEHLQIVCGAHNARAGIKVVLSHINDKIPNGGFVIKKTNIRGAESNGMLCSADELMIPGDSSGIIELPQEAVIGQPFVNFYNAHCNTPATKVAHDDLSTGTTRQSSSDIGYQKRSIDDPIIDVSITPNRSDCFSVYGLARDLAAAGFGKLKDLPLPLAEIDHAIKSPEITITTNKCTKFLAQNICNIHNRLDNTPSPQYIYDYLKAIGMQPISAVVDITNYVCLSLGQPLHAYDTSKINNSLVVAQSDNTNFTALNGKEYQLDDKDIVVKSSTTQEIFSLAGIIGGDTSKCELETTSITLEAAIFDKSSITKSGRKHSVISESRHRFERGVDYQMTEAALAMATSLIQKYCGGVASSVVSISTTDTTTQQRFVTGSYSKIRNIIGFTISNHDINNILRKLGFTIEQCDTHAADDFTAVIPSWRHDIAIMEDVAEEIGRIVGYDSINPTEMPFIKPILDENIPQNNCFNREKLSRAAMINCGYHEVITWSFMSSNNYKYFAKNEPITILNPITNDLDTMRATIIPNLLTLCSKNEKRSISNFGIFEIGPVFSLTTNPSINYTQKTCLSAIWCGDLVEKTNFTPNSKKADIFDIKSHIAFVLEEIGFSIAKCRISAVSDQIYYHPGRAGGIYIGSKLVGIFGEIHPNVLQKLEVSHAIGFEIFLDDIPWPKQKTHLNIPVFSCYQSVTRDFAFLISKETRLGDVISYVQNIDKNIIKSVQLFDIYSGDSIADNMQSIGFSVVMQSDSQTLTENMINELTQKIINNLADKFAVKLRGT